MATTRQPSLFDEPAPEPSRPPDQAARDFAVNPAHDVVLEASAGTGKTRVLVARYVRLLEAGVDPRHILAITFTRKAAAEMRERVLVELRQRADQRLIDATRWRSLQDRVGDIQISTIDAFCFGLLREFPLEADVDPAFEIADETEMARFANEALDITLRIARARLADDEPVRLLFARVKAPVLRQAIAALLDRRHVALPAVRDFVRRTTRGESASAIGAAFVARVRDGLTSRSAELAALVADGPVGAPEFRWIQADLAALGDVPADDPAAVQHFRRRLERYFLTTAGTPRQRVTKPYRPEHFVSAEAKRRHEAALKTLSPVVHEALGRLDADVNALLARGLLRVLEIASAHYERLLDDHTLLDFAAMLDRAVTLLGRQEEFARSRLKLQARYHHVLVDEFQDTSRLQWTLVDLLIDAWGEGEGATDSPTSIFVVGDRKQSIYRFRHAEVTLLDEAARRIGALRGGRPVRRAITVSFRAVPELLAFVNAVSASMEGGTPSDDRFRYDEADRFVLARHDRGRRDGEPVVGLAVGDSMDACAAAVASEIEWLLANATVRDRQGPPRPVRPDDVAILFRARAGHQYFEEALEARGIRTYVYKGLGFFDAPEVQDLQALLRYLARPDSDLRAAELLRSRLIRLSDVALAALAPRFADALASPSFDVAALTALDELDRATLLRARETVAHWIGWVDRVPPGALIDRILADAAYFSELAGRRLDQARENVKKVRALVRRVESRGYATVGRLAEYFETLRAGEESNAIVAASGAVNLMTIHAAKGLEYPVVFVVNLHVAARGHGTGISVTDRGPDGLSDVTFGSSDATRLEEARDAEELKRLFYVAMTRARDRLYLAGQIEGGRLKRNTRAFSGLLPSGLADAMAAAARPGATTVEWESPEGPFDLRVCAVRSAGRPADDGRPEGPPAAIEPVVAAGPEVTSVSAAVEAQGLTAGSTALAAGLADHPAGRAAMDSSRLSGTLVHRLLSREPDPAMSDAVLEGLVRSLVRDEELLEAADLEATVAQAVAAWRAVRRNPEVAALMGPGLRRQYEVPFSLLRAGGVVRGVIDCLVTHPDGRITVLEVKTGVSRPEHRDQAETYRAAIAAAVGGVPVDVKIAYS